MNCLSFDSVLIPLSDDVSLLLEEDKQRKARDLNDHKVIEGLPETWRAVISIRRLDAPTPADRPPFVYDPGAVERGLHALRIFELRDYSWELMGGQAGAHSRIVVSSSLEHSLHRDLWRSHGYYGRFQFINYLGSAWIEASDRSRPLIRLPFEVASPKLDYEFEYRALVEAIGAQCQQLLLEWGTPASLNIAADPAKQNQILLEQFLFLRHVLGPDKLDLYFEIILRHSHSRLERELEWKSFGVADPAFLARNPVHRGRDWRIRGDVAPIPAEMQVERRFESEDTPPNQFIKFVLVRFRELCESVLQAKKNGKLAFTSDDAVCLEAISMLQSLDALLAHPLLRNVGELGRIPFESTTLQRREGYREVLIAWLMLDAAAQLDWPGREDAYDGTTRDVARLYEYWLYFLLVRAFRERLGMVPDSDPLEKVSGALPFCCRADDGRLVINLQQGKASFCRFTWAKAEQKLRVHFFYNRSFGRRTVGERGSYSKTFRPDYTLMIIPEEFDRPDWSAAERDAEKAGRIAYLHFDAKYRVENLKSIFGAVDKEENLAEDDRSREASTAKHEDLYKMHTYNDAIRRTVGSYVLYPGSGFNERLRFERYHEIVPGIGAFAVRPAKEGAPAGLESVCEFVRDVLSHQLNKFTQSYRISSSTEDIIRDAPRKYDREGLRETVAIPGSTLILAYMERAGINRFASEKFFFCPATDENGAPLPIDLSPALGTVLIGYWTKGGRHFVTTDWMASVLSCRLLDRNGVKLETGYEPSDDASFYIFFKLADVASFKPTDVSGLVFAKTRMKQKTTFQTTLDSVFA